MITRVPWAQAHVAVYHSQCPTFQFSWWTGFSIILLLLYNPSFFPPNNILALTKRKKHPPFITSANQLFSLFCVTFIFAHDYMPLQGYNCSTSFCILIPTLYYKELWMFSLFLISNTICSLKSIWEIKRMPSPMAISYW